MKSVTMPGGGTVPALGQGTWKMAERRDRRAAEVAALRAGIDLGMTLIDTAEMYADGAAETLVGEAIAGIRDRVFLVSKTYPQNASRDRLPERVGLNMFIGQVRAMVEAFGDGTGFDAAQWLSTWLRQPVPALGWDKPIDLLDTREGQATVAHVLALMQSGVYA